MKSILEGQESGWSYQPYVVICIIFIHVYIVKNQDKDVNISLMKPFLSSVYIMFNLSLIRTLIFLNYSHFCWFPTQIVVQHLRFLYILVAWLQRVSFFFFLLNEVSSFCYTSYRTHLQIGCAYIVSQISDGDDEVQQEGSIGQLHTSNFDTN